MHEYFRGQITFALHFTYDAIFKTTQTMSAMKAEEANTSFLENTSQTSIKDPSELYRRTNSRVCHKRSITGCRLCHQNYWSIFKNPNEHSFLPPINYNQLQGRGRGLNAGIIELIRSQIKRGGILHLGNITFEAGVHYLEALHRHKYAYFSDYNCDVVQVLLCLYPEI
jgi:hypothetical protein